MNKSEIEQLLPDVFRRTARDGDALSALLELMDALHAPSEAILASIGSSFSARTAPDPLVPFLATWVGMDRLFDRPYAVRATEHAAISSGLGLLRELVASAAELHRWRGTAKGLRLFLATATGLPAFEIEERVLDDAGTVIPFRIRVVAPEAARAHARLVESIIELEKPAYVTSELVYR